MLIDTKFYNLNSFPFEDSNYSFWTLEFDNKPPYNLMVLRAKATEDPKVYFNKYIRGYKSIRPSKEDEIFDWLKKEKVSFKKGIFKLTK